MATRSPGVYIRELDLSDYIQAVSGTIFAVLGGATKGPLNSPVQVFSEEDMIQQFGTPQLGNYGYGIHAMLQFLREGRRGVFVRISDGTHQTSSVNICDTDVSALGVVDEVPAGYGAPLGEFEAASPGTWGNEIRVVISDVEEDPNYAGDSVFNLEVQIPADNQRPVQNWQTIEKFNYLQPELRLSTNPTSDRWYEQVVNRGITGEIAASQYVVATALAQPAWGPPGKAVLPGTYQLGSDTVIFTDGSVQASFVTGGNFVLGDDGVSGIVDADYIGAYVGQTATGLKVFANPEQSDVNMIACPGVFSAAVINEMLSLCETRGDCMAIVDTPFGLNVQGAIDWHNGTGYAHSAFNSSYGAVYWSWVYAYDQYAKKDIWMPASGFAAARYAYNDRVRGHHWAPAGFQRGRVGLALDLEMTPDPSQRDALYTGGNVVNPLVDFVGQGIHIWGQKTLQRRESALQSVNVRRMLLVAKKTVARTVRILNFEQNDESLWRQFINLLTPYFQKLEEDRGIDEFSIIADASTTTALKKDQGIMNGRILLRPTRSAEVIEVDFVIFSSGASFAEAA